MSSAELRLTLLVHRQRRWSAREAMNEAGCPSEASFAKFAAIRRSSLERCCENRRKAVPYVTTQDRGRNRIIPGPLVAP